MHKTFGEAIDLPDHYGNNLDALHDVLFDVFEPVTVLAGNTDLLKKALGRRWTGFLRLMNDIEKEKQDFRYISEPFSHMTEI